MEEDAKKVSTSGRDLGRHRKRQQDKRGEHTRNLLDNLSNELTGAAFNGRKGGNRKK